MAGEGLDNIGGAAREPMAAGVFKDIHALEQRATQIAKVAGQLALSLLGPKPPPGERKAVIDKPERPRSFIKGIRAGLSEVEGELGYAHQTLLAIMQEFPIVGEGEDPG